MPKPKVFIIILNWNSSFESIRLFNQLKNYTNYKDIYILDNYSKLYEQQILKDNIPSGKYLQTGANLGYAGGNNIGIKLAIKEGADFVCILNPDIEIKNDFITPLVDKCILNSNIGVIGPRICLHNSNEIIYSDGGLVYPKKGYRTTHINSSLKESNCEFIEYNHVDYVNGSAMVVPVESFKHVGYMREDFFLYYEETEWCMRLKDINKEVIVSTHQKVYHKPSAKGSRYNFYMNRNRIWLSKIRGENVYSTLIFSIYSYFIQLIRFKSDQKFTTESILKGILIGIFTSPKGNNNDLLA